MALTNNSSNSLSNKQNNTPFLDLHLPKSGHGVTIIDPDVKRRAAVSFFLSNNSIIAEPFENTDEFLDSQSKPSIILIYDLDDAIYKLFNEITLLRRPIPIIAYLEDPIPARVVDAVIAGAVGYVSWPAPDDALLKAISRAILHAAPSNIAVSRMAASLGKIARLSEREREILDRMSEGLSNRQIGSTLRISPRTVELHRANLLDKLGARSSAEAIRIAIEASLTTQRHRLGPLI